MFGPIFPKFKLLDQICSIKRSCVYIRYISNHICCISFANNRANIVTENPKTLKTLPLYQLYTKAWPKIRKLWANPKKCQRRKKAIPIRFTKVNVVNICRPSLFNQKYNVGWFLQGIFVDLPRVSSLHIISRNHSNTFLLINLQKTKTCPSKILQQGLFALILSCHLRQSFVHYLMSILMI